MEAKNESLRGGVAQCIAELVAAQMFNAARGTEGGRGVRRRVVQGGKTGHPESWSGLRYTWP